LEWFGVIGSGTHEKAVLEAGILEKLIDAVIETAEKDEDKVSVKDMLVALFSSLLPIIHIWQ